MTAGLGGGQGKTSYLAASRHGATRHCSTPRGKPAADFASVILGEAVAIIKREGIQRARYGLCMTCLDRGQMWQADWRRGSWSAEWDGNPSARLGREIGHKRREELLNKELRALAEVAAAHPDEFAAWRDGTVTSMAELRRKKAKR